MSFIHYLWPQEINLRDLTAAIKLFSLTLTLRSSPLSAERSVSLLVLSSRLKREKDGAVFISSGTDEGFCAGVVTLSGVQETRLPDVLSDLTHPLHYCSGSNRVLTLRCLTGNCLISHGWWVIREEEKMDEAVKPGEVEECVQLLFYVDVTTDRHQTTVKDIVNVTQIDVMQ
ncbi:hypothetical protein NQZ68_015723 [Dissostichus eleginoides]|nr:hypothetical protein NQZ68_015723 [Dissostichus eleginoides]